MKKFFKIVDSSGVTHQFAATGVASVNILFPNSDIKVTYTNGSQVVFGGATAFSTFDTDALFNTIASLNESKWTSTVDTVVLSQGAPTVTFTF